MSVADNLARVRERVIAAAVRCGRSPDSVRLMAVSKTFPADAIREAHAAGQRLFGENKVQEYADKSAALRDLDSEVHLIGHLQSNKSTKAAEVFHAIDTVDSVKLLRRLEDACRTLDKSLPVLIEINVGNEEQKSGVDEGSPELEAMLASAAELEHVSIRGLMCIPPWSEDAEQSRPYFRKLHTLRDTIAARNLPNVSMDDLSMGMSNDFEVAIEEGSTCVRIGTAIFGRRVKVIA